MFKFLVFSVFVLFETTSFAQKLLTTSVLNSNSYCNYENDLFARTDRYYTQGIDLGINHLLVRTEERNELKRFEFSQNVYTPTTIKYDSLLVNDRPYAATLTAKYEKGILRTDHFSYLFGTEVGVIGPAAGGKQMQTGIHKATNNFLPLGWQHQINNGLVADVYAKIEKPLVRIDSVFQFIGGVSARLGTLQTNVTPSFLLVFGNRETGKINLFFENSISAIGYDGTLQGSLVSSKNEYVLRSNEVEHFVFKSELSLLLRIRRFGLLFNYSIQSKTFAYQLSDFHSWGGVSLIFSY